MASGSKGHSASIVRKTRRSHRETKTASCEVIVYEVVKALQHGAGAGVAFEFMQSFRVNAVREDGGRNGPLINCHLDPATRFL
jgi:hypothetical protein